MPSSRSSMISHHSWSEFLSTKPFPMSRVAPISSDHQCPRAVLGFPISAGAARTKRLSRYYELHIWRTGLFAILPLAIIPMMG